MSLNEILLIGAAILPAVLLCIFVFKKDRVEKEPIGLLLGLLGLGCVICFPAAELETILDDLIHDLFASCAVEHNGVYYLQGLMYYIYHGCKYFIGVALVEEGLKFLAMFLMTRYNKNFNSLFDGVVYAVFVSLGFAALENILYVLQYGWTTAIMRAILSVPGHMFFGVLMGYYYSFWHMEKLAQQEELRLIQYGYLPKNAKVHTGNGKMILCLLMPVLMHGMYDFCCTLDSVGATLIFYGLIIFLYIYCFRKINRLSLVDVDDRRYSVALVLQYYPHLKTLYQPRPQQETYQ